MHSARALAQSIKLRAYGYPHSSFAGIRAPDRAIQILSSTSPRSLPDGAAAATKLCDVGALRRVVDLKAPPRGRLQGQLLPWRHRDNGANLRGLRGDGCGFGVRGVRITPFDAGARASGSAVVVAPLNGHPVYDYRDDRRAANATYFTDVRHAANYITSTGGESSPIELR